MGGKDTMTISARNMNHLLGKKVHLTNGAGNPMFRFYMEVVSLPGDNGVGKIHNVDDHDGVKSVTDVICYRVGDDGGLIAWLECAGETDDQLIPINPHFDTSGELISMTFQFDVGYVIDYLV